MANLTPEFYNPKRSINYLHYNRANNTIVEPVDVPALTGFFENTVPVEVRNSVDFSLLATTNLRWTVFKNMYLFYIDFTHVPDTGVLQDVLLVDFPFNNPNGPAPFNPTGSVIMCGDTDFILNSDLRAGTLTIGIIGEANRLLVWPDKLLNGGGITADANVFFGNSCFMVGFFNDEI